MIENKETKDVARMPRALFGRIPLFAPSTWKKHLASLPESGRTAFGPFDSAKDSNLPVKTKQGPPEPFPTPYAAA